MATPPTASSLLALAKTDVTLPIPKETVYAVLASPPFVYIPGTFNTRDLGLLPVPSGSPSIRPGFAFRTASLEGLAPEGHDAIRALGIKRVFDLRSMKEHRTKPDPVVEGVEGSWVAGDERDAMEDLSGFVEGEGEKGYERMYLDVMRMYRGSLREVLVHVRDREGEGFMFHCNAGRDRTGVAAGMLLALAGVDPDAITLDFMLSRVGTEPAREQLLAFAMRGTGVTSVDAPGFYNLCSLKVASWERFVKGVEREYGGWEGYVTGTLGFSEEDLEKIKKNLVAKE
ncbi:protein-tyrosine phosphatase-like protein [Cercophora newfieldiana]|uniref:Protein-tyrosine phosphatase-like protein n=1 Tax=Cercophora newfieldiana TaxID=92897 RepID=A0AA39XZA9_9PEZI|nr:protein-tyrosine phosphatase-like protein [Cercophora newfieldiana]